MDYSDYYHGGYDDGYGITKTAAKAQIIAKVKNTIHIKTTIRCQCSAEIRYGQNRNGIPQSLSLHLRFEGTQHSVHLLHQLVVLVSFCAYS